MPSRRLISNFVGAVAVPLICFVALMVFPHQKLSTRDLIGMCALAPINGGFFALPQIGCFVFWRSALISRAAFWGGVIAADVLLIALTVMFLWTTNDGDSIGWLLYFVGCVPVVPFGLFLGKVTGGMIARKSSTTDEHG